jgi:hypothetical protein
MKDAFGFTAFLRDPIGGRPFEPVRKRPVMGADGTVRATHFIEGRG